MTMLVTVYLDTEEYAGLVKYAQGHGVTNTTALKDILLEKLAKEEAVKQKLEKVSTMHASLRAELLKQFDDYKDKERKEKKDLLDRVTALEISLKTFHDAIRRAAVDWVSK